jgi:hypothetical protein
VGDPVDLDELHRTVGGGDESVGTAAHDDAARVGAAALEVGVDGDGVSGGVGHRDPEPGRPGAEDGDLVGGAAQLEVDGAPDIVLHLGAPAARGVQQSGALDRLGLLVGLDAGDHERHTRVLARDQPTLRADAVDPPGVGRAVDDLGLVEQVEDERLVRRPTLDDDGRLAHGTTQPGQRLVTVTTVGDDLRDHRVEVGGDRIALGHTGVDPDAGACGQVEVGDAPGGGAKSRSGSSALSRASTACPTSLGRSPSSGRPDATCDLEP